MSGVITITLWDENLDYGTPLSDGTLVGTIAKLNELAAKVPAENMADVHFKIENDGYGDDSDLRLKIFYKRYKTMEEMQAEIDERERQSVQWAIEREEKERATYEALKAKYGE